MDVEKQFILKVKEFVFLKDGGLMVSNMDMEGGWRIHLRGSFISGYGKKVNLMVKE